MSGGMIGPGVVAAAGWWRWLALAMLTCAHLLMAGSRAAERIETRDVRIELVDEYWLLSTDFRIDLPVRLEEAINRGVALYFTVDFEMTRPRWYWFDEKAAAATLTWRVSYNALTRQYRLTTGTLQLGFPSLAEALGVMTRVRNWRVAERSAVRPGETYQAAVRMRLDTSQLPKPFQINAITDRDWNLESDWRRFSIAGEAPR